MKILKLVSILLLLASAESFAATYLDPALVGFAGSRSDTRIRVIALLKPSQSPNMPRRYDSANVKKFLMQNHRTSFSTLAPLIKSNPREISLKYRFWINDSVALDVSPQGLKLLLQVPEIEKIYANRKVNYDRPVYGRSAGFDGSDYTYGLKDIGIDKLNAERPEVTGQGVIVGHVDTGIDGKHPALSGKIKLFFDAATGKIAEAFDPDMHGTHTAGTILGGDRVSNKIGVAPGAKIIGSSALGEYDQMLKAMQFMLDPDGNPDTQDSPRLISNSWNCEGAPDVELFYRAISAWEAAGILPVFSAGNAGPKTQSITKPHEHPATVAVGATDISGKLASFSSRGPANYKGKLSAKPDFTAPGVKVYSSVPGGRYAELSGTSMACPHAAGIATLLFQVNPKFTPQNVREIMLRSLKPVDENGNTTTKITWNAYYGYGRLDAYAAVKLALGRSIQTVLSLASPGELLFDGLGISTTESETADQMTSSFSTDSAAWVQVRGI